MALRGPLSRQVGSAGGPVAKPGAARGSLAKPGSAGGPVAKPAALTAAALAAFALTGCEPDGADALSSTAPASVEESVSAEVPGNDGSARTGTDVALPLDWPAALALPDGVWPNSVVDTGAGTVVSAATTYTSVGDCVTAFQGAWSDDSVTIADVVITADAGGLRATLTDGTTADVAVTMTGQTATAVITLN